MLPKPLAYAILILITLVWATNFAAALLLPGYESDVYIHFIFMGTVGLILGIGQHGKRGAADGPGDDSEQPSAAPQLPKLPWGRQ